MPEDQDDEDVVTSITRPTRGTPIGPADPVEEEAVTGRPQDEPAANSTFADRAKARKASEKRIASAENKTVSRTRRTKKR